ncbi:MAG: methyltransferase domain-containing protein [Rhabdochlamydiaceae bacterium]|nr:methyltransferase domain-containing protein [Rhabdochlamydiaceae bacterium]
MKDRHIDTSWESSSLWYDKTVGAQGHYYHRQVVLPGALKLLGLKPNDSLLDLACGQGILARHIPKAVSYLGVDASRSLIQSAKQTRVHPSHLFAVHDLNLPLTLDHPPFTHAACILALQNIDSPETLFQTASLALKSQGTLVLVINHPCFRIPRQSHWGIDPQKKLQYRRLDMYMSALKIPIQTHPSQKNDSPTTWSFHRPLSTYTRLLKEAGFNISAIEEWCSDKKSTGKMASVENRSRQEFPLFLAIAAQKN